MGNLCACGCGGRLPEGSNRAYKRGHRKTMDASVSSDVERLAEAGPDDLDSPDEWERISLEDAAKQTPDDPEPEQTAEDKPQQILRITKRIRDDVEGKVAMMLGVTASMGSMVDPVCGNALAENSGEIASKLTPVICKSPEAVNWLRKTGNFTLWIDLMVACWPVIATVFAHHMAKRQPVTVDPLMPVDNSVYSAA